MQLSVITSAGKILASLSQFLNIHLSLNYEFGRMYKEAMVAYFKILYPGMCLVGLWNTVTL
jgi:hypothetical protein